MLLIYYLCPNIKRRKDSNFGAEMNLTITVMRTIGVQ